MATLTGSNSVLTLTVENLFPNGVVISGFAVDDSFRVDAVPQVETLMGVDGILSAGFVYNPYKMTITLQGDSNSAPVFDTVASQQYGAADAFRFDGTIALDNGIQYTLTNGYMTSWHAFPDVKKLLQPRSFEITWQSITPSPQ